MSDHFPDVGKKVPRTPTPVLIKALEALSRDVQSEDGVANAALFEAAQRMGEMDEFVKDAAHNWDCDEDGHKYGTYCRACEAKIILGEIPV